MRILNLFSLCVVVIVAFSCKTEKSNDVKKENFFDTIFINDSIGLIRGSNMAVLPDEVLKNEPGKPVLENDSILEYVYDYELPTGKTKTRLHYNFDEFGLFEIQIDLYPETEEDAKKMITEIDEYLTQKFGNSKALGTVKRWTTFGQSNRLIEITLSNETADFGKPFVSLNYLEPLPDEI